MRILALSLLAALPCLGVEIIAHRGASHDAPENTLASVNLGWAKRADAVEIDVHLSKDGRIVVIHDQNTRRTTGMDKPVVKQNLAELHLLDAGHWKGERWKGEKIPTLEDALATIPDGKRMFVEVKCGPEIIPALANTFEKLGKNPSQLTVISFSYDVVKEAKKRFPKISCYYLSSFKKNNKTGKFEPSASELIRKAKAAGLEGINVNHRGLVDATFFRKVKNAGLGIYTWTVNSPDDAKRLIKLGIDGITTDRPAWLKENITR